MSVPQDREGAAAGEGDRHVAEKRAALQGFQGGHPAASLGLPGPVVVVGEVLKLGLCGRRRESQVMDRNS